MCLVFQVGGISSSSTRNTEGNLVPDVLRYAQNIKLSVKIQVLVQGLNPHKSYSSLLNDATLLFSPKHSQLQAPQQIFPPTLTIYYNERRPSDWAGAPGMKIDTITFQVRFSVLL